MAAPETDAIVLTDRDMPELFRSADAISVLGQRRFVRSTALQLCLLFLAAGAAAVQLHGDVPEAATVIAAGAFFAAAVLKMQLLATQPDREWYEGRAAAESAKTLAWRYSVGGAPFGTEACSPKEANQRYLQRLREVSQPLDLPLIPSVERVEQITDAMKRLRGETLEHRRRSYVTGRLEEQLSWYTRKAVYNQRRARMWNTALLGLMVGGGLLAVVNLIGAVRLDVLDAVAAGIGGVAAWIATKQHETLASAYSVTARELADINVLAEEPRSEAEWESFVGHAEEAISREHTLWRASRGS